MDSLHTHTYDGLLNTNNLPNLSSIKDLSFDIKRNYALELLNTATQLYVMNPVSLSYLEKIISSMGSEANIDHTNNLVADDLLCLCWIHRHNEDFMKVLESQLSDMSTGFCSQGRTHRLYQTILAFA